GKLTVFKNSIPIKKGYTFDQLVNALLKKHGLEKTNCLKIKIFIYKSMEFRENFKKKASFFWDLYRGNPVILQNEITENMIKNRTKLTANVLKYFLSKKNTFSIYEYYFPAKIIQSATTSAAMLRILASM